MYCNKCGYKLNTNEKFCKQCGSKLLSDSSSLNYPYANKNDLFIYNTSSNAPAKSRKIKYDSHYNYEKKSKAYKYAFLLALICFIIAGIFMYVDRDKIFGVKGKRTIMIYMIGSDLESKYYSATADINEIIGSDADFNNINILLYTGGAKTWHTDDIPSDGHAIFKIDSNGLELLESYPTINNMVDPENLTYFLQYGYDNFKAEKYSLIFWNHGGGPIYGYGFDEYNKTDSLTMKKISSALRNSPFNHDNQLEFIGFDACLMASAEVAYTLSDYSKYMIASQEVEPGAGWSYDFLGKIRIDSTAIDIGKSIIDSYSNYYSDKVNGKGISLSLINLEKVENLENKLNDLFSNVDENLVLEFSSISRSRSSTKSYGRVSQTISYDLVDMYDLIEHLPKKYYDLVENLKNSIDDMIIYQKTDLNNTHGISLYFPYENKENLSNIIEVYKDMNFASEYTNFIDSFSSKLTGQRLYNWNLTKNIPVMGKDRTVSIEIPKEVADNYSSASYIIFEKDEEDYYTPRYIGTDVILTDNVLSTALVNKALVAKSKDAEVYLSAIESEVGVDYIKYSIPGTLQKIADYNFEVLAVYIQLIVDDEHPNGIISGAVPLNSEENQTYAKSSIDINDWTYIDFLNYKYKIFDDDGRYTSNWEGSGLVTGFEAEVSEEFSISFEDFDPEKDFYCMFNVKDSQGNVYKTNVVKVENY